ncbi:hypothetical protein ALC57_03696 [Trachymyrmex cornetzi]|uniref:Uncharacterized protein n=1 Tax=Trachymyrmex cornetzi TaxID=471704 RepID=A0A151JMB2_9HYME|nr:hypothetical protein ALC57_03696 [Trachymyrmex cornetzi]
MQFNPRNLIILLSAVFTVLDFPESPITSEEITMKRKMEKMLKDMYENYFEIEVEEALYFLNLYDVPEAQEIELVDEEENYACNVKEMVCDIDDVSAEYIRYSFIFPSKQINFGDDTWQELSLTSNKRRAVEYWRSGKLKPRTIESVKSKFRKVISAHKLQRWEKHMNVDAQQQENLLGFKASHE